jgi:amino acid transporter
MNSTAIGLIVDGLFGPVLKWGFHYEIAGFEVWLGEILLASFILILFGMLNIWGVKKAGFVQTILASLLIVSVFTLFIGALASPYATIENMDPIWGFDKAGAITAGGYDASHAVKDSGIASSILATFAIAPWAFVGFDTIPQAAEEFKCSYKKVIFIMFIAIAFGCFVYIANNTIAAAALENWPDLIVNAEGTPWLLLTAAEKILGPFGKVLVGIAVSCAVLSGIMGFYLASSRLMYSMSKDGYLPLLFGKVDQKRRTPKNAIIFCMIISLAGPVLGREALGWFVDMSAIGASIGFMFTCLSTYKTMKRDGDGSVFLKVLSILGSAFSIAFMILQLIPIPGLDGVHFGYQSYIMLGVWVVLDLVFYIIKRKTINAEKVEEISTETHAEE